MESKKGFIVCSRNGHGKLYFFETEKEAWDDVNKNHPKYSIWQGEVDDQRWTLRTLIKR